MQKNNRVRAALVALATSCCFIASPAQALVEVPLSGDAGVKVSTALTYSCQGGTFSVSADGNGSQSYGELSLARKGGPIPIAFNWGLTFGNKKSRSVATSLVDPSVSAQLVSGDVVSEEVPLSPCSGGSATFAPAGMLLADEAALRIDPVQQKCNLGAYYVALKLRFAQGVTLRLTLREGNAAQVVNLPLVGTSRVYSLFSFVTTGVSGNAGNAAYSVEPDASVDAGVCKDML